MSKPTRGMRRGVAAVSAELEASPPPTIAVRLEERLAGAGAAR
jgi:hypothetical protein